MEVPECPVCLEDMTAPVFQCQSGHSLCSACSSALSPAKCPVCRRDMTQMRNWMLEEIIANARAARAAAGAAAGAAAAAAAAAPARAGGARLQCPHQPDGCPYVFSAGRDVHEHVRECIFRDMLCPHGAVFNDCFWIGKLKQMMDHFKLKHPSGWSTFSAAAGGAALLAAAGARAARRLWLAAQGNMHFLVTMKVDPDDSMAYFAVQHIGNKKNAQQWTYEIQITSGHDAGRMAVFSERCFNDVVAADEIFRQGKCACLPLRLLPLYAREEKLAFRFAVKKAGVVNSIANLRLAHEL